jgi:D-alanine transaminase
MSIAYLDGNYLPLEEARISPMDRGFLFGDGIYEVVPSYAGKMVGFAPHIARMQAGLASVGIKLGWSEQQWAELCNRLIADNGSGNLGIYLHVSRGADTKRFHAFPEAVTPTVFAFAFDIAPPPVADKALAKPYKGYQHPRPALGPLPNQIDRAAGQCAAFPAGLRKRPWRNHTL